MKHFKLTVRILAWRCEGLARKLWRSALRPFERKADFVALQVKRDEAEAQRAMAAEREAAEREATKRGEMLAAEREAREMELWNQRALAEIEGWKREA